MDFYRLQCEEADTEITEKKPRRKIYAIRLAKLLALLIGVSVLAVLIVVMVLFLVPSNERDANPPVVFPISPSLLAKYEMAAVASNNGNCSVIGSDMLKRGGSAVDAAIAAMICNGCVGMHDTGIGGGLFAVVWDSHSKSSKAFDAYGVAPDQASNDLFGNQPQAIKFGNLSVLVPGEIAGFRRLHSEYGKLPWRDLFWPTIKLCKEGFRVGPDLAYAISYFVRKSNWTTRPEMQNLANFLTNPLSKMWFVEGDLMKCPKLAETLTLLAENGPDDFYRANGTLARLVLEDLAELETLITESDLVEYIVNSTRKPVKMAMHDDVTLYTPGPSSSGVIGAFILNILSGYNWTSLSGQDAINYHRYIEALKFGWAQWSYFGDVAFCNETEANERIFNITSLKMGNFVRKKINDSYVLPLENYGTYGTPSIFGDAGEHESTSHVSVLDAFGSAISLTSTINGHFGSFLMGRRTGIIFNNGMKNFRINQKVGQSLPPPPNNFIEPRKRPMTSLSPMIFVKDNTVRLVVGASGSNRIVATVPYVAIRNLFFGESVKEAIDAFRFQSLLIPSDLYYERDWPEWMLQYLGAKGHIPQKAFSSAASSVCQAIERLSNGSLFANADFRFGGSSTAGY